MKHMEKDGGSDLEQGINRQAHGSTGAPTSSATELYYDEVLLHVKQPPAAVVPHTRAAVPAEEVRKRTRLDGMVIA